MLVAWQLARGKYQLCCDASANITIHLETALGGVNVGVAMLPGLALDICGANIAIDLTGLATRVHAVVGTAKYIIAKLRIGTLRTC